MGNAISRFAQAVEGFNTYWIERARSDPALRALEAGMQWRQNFNPRLRFALATELAESLQRYAHVYRPYLLCFEEAGAIELHIFQTAANASWYVTTMAGFITFLQEEGVASSERLTGGILQGFGRIMFHYFYAIGGHLYGPQPQYPRRSRNLRLPATRFHRRE